MPPNIQQLEIILEKYPIKIGIIGGNEIRDGDIKKINKIIIGLLNKMKDLDKKQLLFITSGKTYLQYLFYRATKNVKMNIMNIPMNDEEVMKRAFSGKSVPPCTTLSGEEVIWEKCDDDYVLSLHNGFLNNVFKEDRDLLTLKIDSLPALFPAVFLTKIETLKKNLEENPLALKGDTVPAPKIFTLKNFYFTQLCDMYILFEGGVNVQAEGKVLEMFDVPVVTIKKIYVDNTVDDDKLAQYVDQLFEEVIANIEIIKMKEKISEYLKSNEVAHSTYLLIERDFIKYLKTLNINTLKSFNIEQMKKLNLSKDEFTEMLSMYVNGNRDKFLDKLKFSSVELLASNKYLKYKIKYTKLKKIQSL